MASPTRWTWSLAKLWEMMVKDREALHAAARGVANSQTQPLLKKVFSNLKSC